MPTNPYGSFQFGQSPYGGPGLITVLAVLPLTNGAFVVVFDTPPKGLDIESPTSGVNAHNYLLAAVDPTYYSETSPEGILAPGLTAPTRFPYASVAALDPLNTSQVVVQSDSPLEPGIRYTVEVSEEIRGLDCEVFSGPTVWDFTAPGYPRTPQGIEVVEQRYRDFAWGPVGTEEAQGLESLQHDATNDIGIQGSLESLRKRLKRRVFTQKGGFIWSPQYGVGVKAKQLVSGGNLQSLASAVAEQLRLEPDVVDCSADVSVSRTSQGSFVEIAVHVIQRDQQVRRILFREPV